MPDGKLTLIKLLDAHSNDQIAFSQNFSATLLQIPRQKYNIGSSYKGRKENEEFIFFVYFLEKGQEFQINVDENGSFWIQSESKKSGLSVNGVPVKEKKSHKLNFGDEIEIVFTIPATMTKKKEGLFSGLTRKQMSNRTTVVLTFSERGFKGQSEEYFETFSHPKTEEDLTTENDPAFFVGSNELIIQKILDKIPFHLLPNLRLVSSLWNTLALPLVRKNCPTFLYILKYVPVGGENVSTELCRHIANGDAGTIFIRFEKEMKNLSPEKLVFSIQNFELPPPKTDENAQKSLQRRRKKFEDDLLHFLKHFCGRIKHLVISENLSGGNPCESFLNEVFTHLSPGLESLELNEKMLRKSQNGFTKEWNFHNLKVLKISENFQSRNDDIVGNEQWAGNIVAKLGPKFEKYEGLGGPLFREICLQKFPNLSSLSLFDVGGSDLKLLRDLNPLKNLSLSGLISHYSEPWLLANALENHSQTFETLDLFVVSNDKLVFPRFPKLKDFTLVRKPLRVYTAYFFSDLAELKRLILGWAERPSLFEDLGGRSDEFERYILASESNVLKLWNDCPQVFNISFPNLAKEDGEKLKSLKIYHLDSDAEEEWG